MVLIDWVRRGLPNGILSCRIDPRDRIRDATVAMEKSCAFDEFGDCIPVRPLPLRRRDIGDVAPPSRVVHMDVTIVPNGGRQARRLGDHAISHEGAHTHKPIIGATDVMSDAGVDAP